MATTTLHRVCPLCRQDNKTQAAHKISDDTWTVKCCSGCGFVYLENVPSYEALSEEFAWEKQTKREEQRRQEDHGFQDKLSKATRFRLKFPRKKVPALLEAYAQPGRVVDVGCGDGGAILEVSDQFEPYGIEISKALAEAGSQNLGERGGYVVHAPALEGLLQLPENTFSAVVMRAFLEHESKPAEVLDAAFRVLQPGGIAIVKVPNYGSINAAVMQNRWCGIRLPDHVNYFTPASLSTMVKQAGFTIQEFGILSFRQPTSDNMWMIAQKN